MVAMPFGPTREEAGCWIHVQVGTVEGSLPIRHELEFASPSQRQVAQMSLGTLPV